MEVVGVNRINHRLEADLVGGPMRVTGFTGPGEKVVNPSWCSRPSC